MRQPNILVARWLNPLQSSLALLLALAALTVGVAACSSDDTDDSASGAPTLSDPAATGEELTTTYIQLLADQDVEGLSDFLSAGFMIQRADGSHDVKDNYLKDLPNIGEFRITDVSAEQVDGSLVVRWLLEVNEVINDNQYANAPAPRLSTFVWTDGDWRLFSHANFNAPPSEDAPETSSSSGR